MDYIYKATSYINCNYLELIATITGIIYLILSVRGKKLLWLFGIISSFLYVYIFFDHKIYADMGINIYYVIISIYGWIHWNTKSNQGNLPFSRLKLKMALLLTFVTFILFGLIAFILTSYTDSDVAIFDALLTAASITATWMLARKIIEHWLIWIVVDGISIGLYVYKGLFPTVFLFLFYTVLAVVGFFEWLKLWKTQESQ